MNIAIIIDNKVENIAVFESLERAQEMYSDAICIDTAVTTCGIGWTYDPTTRECIAPPKPKTNINPTENERIEAKLDYIMMVIGDDILS